jgi:hypothetical protein
MKWPLDIEKVEFCENQTFGWERSGKKDNRDTIKRGKVGVTCADENGGKITPG